MDQVTLATGETLTFDEAAHLYTIDGDPCPGTHALMERHEIVKPLDQFTAPYAERGRRVDFYTQAWDENDLDREDVDSTERGYLDAWIQFRKEDGHRPIRPDEIQALVGSAQLWYATKIDRILEYPDGRYICNLKTGQVYAKPHAIQAHLELILVPDCARVIYVYVAPDGSYKIEDYTDNDEARKTATAMAQANGMAHHYTTSKKRKAQLAKGGR